ncbi:uncharacterized protein LOC142597644 isoform X2 [Dermatophagoides farinae]|uniref:uncharacterized protein LOC142597644 isoform X2 n=1 Tax=Dermatophagoides farinae TaxID=6954 RepID=UPI003F605166
MSSAFITIPANTIQALKNIGYSITTTTNANIIPNDFSNNNNTMMMKDNDKKVEVRWLDSEAELYIKQWRRRYRQLEAIDNNNDTKRLHSSSSILWPPSNQSSSSSSLDDWYRTAHTILDLDVSYLNSKEYHKYKWNDEGFDLIFNNRSKPFSLFIDDDDNYNFNDDEDLLTFHQFTHQQQQQQQQFLPFEAMITLDPTIPINQEFLAVLKSNNLMVKNGKLLEKENIVSTKDNHHHHHHHHNNNKVYEKQTTRRNQKQTAHAPAPPPPPPPLVPTTPITNVIEPLSSSTATMAMMNMNELQSAAAATVLTTPLLAATNITPSPSSQTNHGGKCNNSSSGKSQRNRNHHHNQNNNSNQTNNNNNTTNNSGGGKPRNRPSSTRRQMYICEYPGCTYQSDRNFNFLRHKRTHIKQKNDSDSGHQKRNSNNNNNNNNSSSTLTNVTATPTTTSSSLVTSNSFPFNTPIPPNATNLMIMANNVPPTSSCFESPTTAGIEFNHQNGLIMTTNLHNDSTLSNTSPLLPNDFSIDLGHHHRHHPSALPTTISTTPATTPRQQQQLNIVATATNVESTINLPTTVSITENGHPFILSTGSSIDHDNYLQPHLHHNHHHHHHNHHQNIIMKDINNFEHLLADNHHFSTLTLDQSFLS